VSFTIDFKYLGSIIHHTLTSDADIDIRISKAAAAFGALRKDFYSQRRLKEKTKGRIFLCLCLSILLYGSECWCLREDLFRRLRVFFNRCVRQMCRITMRQVIKHRISDASLRKRLGIESFDTYYNSRLLRWVGHAARMKMDRTPRRLLTGWVDNARPVGAPQMTWGRTVNKALKARGLPLDFAKWSKIANNRAKWREKTQPHKRKPKPKPTKRQRPGNCDGFDKWGENGSYQLYKIPHSVIAAGPAAILAFGN